LNVQLREGGPKINVINEVLERRAQYGVSASDIVYSRLNNKPVVVVASIFQHSASALAVAKESGIISPHDLIGKKVNILVDGKPIIEIAAMLEFEGVAREKVQLAEWQLQAGDHSYDDVEYIYLSSHPYFFLKNKKKINIIKPINYGVDFYGDALFTTEQELEEYPDTVEKMRKAVIKGWQYALQHPNETIKMMMQTYTISHSFEHLKYEAKITQELISPHAVEIGHTSLSRWKRMSDAIIRLKMLPSSENFDGLIYSKEDSDTNLLWGVLGFILAVAGIVSLISIAFFILNRHLKRRVADKTTELQLSNEQLHKEVFQRRQMGKELQQNSDNLESTVSLRTRELHLEVKEHQLDLKLLSQSEAKLKSVLSSMSDTVYLIDQRKKIAFFHGQNEQTTLINMQGSVLGKDLDSLIPNNVLADFDKAIEENKKGHIVEIDCFKDQSQRWFAVKLSPLFEDHYYRGSLAVREKLVTVNRMKRSWSKQP